MGKLKVFIITCFMLIMSCVTVFADTVDNPTSRAMGLDDNKYYVQYESSKTPGLLVLYTFNEYDFNENNYFRMMKPKEYHYINGEWVDKSSNNNVYFSNVLKNIKTNHYVFYNYVMENNLYDGELISPPEMAPTVKEAIAKIVPDLSAQLKILLPVGVTILSIMLGVSLVPRLVRSFL